MEFSPKLAAALVLALASAMVATAWNEPQDIVDAHNVVRAEVGVGPVLWDDTVAAYAQSYAEKRRADCQLVHSPAGRPYGENLFRTPSANWNVVDAVIYWASGKQYYDHDTNTCSAANSASCGEYLQVVWRDTTYIGCAAAHCDGDVEVLIICSYSPPPMEGQTPY